MSPLIKLLILPLVCLPFAACETQNLVFFTNTTIGAEISVNPSDGSGPAKIIIGYKRAEGVLDPIYSSTGMEGYATSVKDSNGNSNATVPTTLPASTSQLVKKYRPESSVLAKINGGVTASAAQLVNGQLSAAQWFATGQAATNLSIQPGIAGAVTGSAPIAAAASLHGGAVVQLSLQQTDDSARVTYQSLINGTPPAAGLKDTGGNPIADPFKYANFLAPTVHSGLNAVDIYKAGGPDLVQLNKLLTQAGIQPKQP